jgi:putative ABC transport system permease protein
MNGLLHDLRYGIRMWIKNPVFTAVAIFTLALGIGANSAIFSVINAILFRELPYENPEQLVLLWGNNPRAQLASRELPTSAANFLSWKEQSQSFTQLAGFRAWPFIVTGGNNPERIWGARVSGNLFQLLGVKPILGRDFLPEEDAAGGPSVVIISHNLWQRRFAADRGVIGKDLQVDGKNYQIAGVAPPRFGFPQATGMPTLLRFPEHTDLWIPLAFTDKEKVNRTTNNLAVIGRLKPSVTVDQAQAEMSNIVSRLAQQYESNKDLNVSVSSLHEQMVRQSRTTLYVLLAAVGFVLLIACGNVANLLLGRAAARQREVAIRIALGAKRSRLIRQLLTESLMLSLTGGLLGLLIGVGGYSVLVAVSPPGLLYTKDIGLDLRVLGFTVLLSIVTGIIFGLVPALQTSKTNLQGVLKESGRGSTGSRSRNRFRGLLVVSEVALALMLLIGAGLLINSFLRLQRTNLGLNPKNVLTMEIMLPFLPPSPYAADEQRMSGFFTNALERIAALPGVTSAGATTSLPLSGGVQSAGFTARELPAPAPGQGPSAQYAVVTPDFFRTIEAPLLRGRAFNNQDTATSVPVIIINEACARSLWPNEDAVGKHLMIGFEEPVAREIVGVVGDTKQSDIDIAVKPAMYLPHLQSPTPLMTIVVRTTSDPAAMNASVRNQIATVDKDVPVSNVMTMEQVVSTSVAPRSFNMVLLSIFAVVALVLAVVGIYGVLSYSVTQRTHELGLRMALGAQPNDVLKLVLSHGMKLIVIGVVIGLVGAFVLMRLMSSLLFGIDASDPLTFGLIAGLLSVVALIACYFPARRATKVNPIIALREG